MTQLHKTCNLGAPRLKRFLAASSVSQEEHVNPESKSLFFCFFLNTSVFIPLEHVYSNQTWAESSIIKVPVKSCTLSPTSPACRPYKHPPTHKYLILPNPDRKCPRQWSRMLLTDPRLLFLPRSALSLLPPSSAEWYMCPSTSCHLETVSPWTFAQSQEKHVYL